MVLLDDSVHYELYPFHAEDSPDESLQPSFYLQQIAHLLAQYPWHESCFNLVTDDKNNCLVGETNFGDNIEDEWFIVFLLCELSKKNKGLVVRTIDNDGDFLLIEGADYLPKWVNPESSENRVYIYEGNIHIIPIGNNPSQLTPLPFGKPNVLDAVNVIRNFPDKTQCSSQIQKACFRRILEYPEKISSLLHLCQVTLPSSYASLITQYPSVISLAINSYCDHDPSDPKLINFYQKLDSDELVTINIHLTKILYAKLKQSPFITIKLSKLVPPCDDPKHTSTEIGFKLSSGLDIALHKGKKLKANTKQEGDIFGTREGKKYLNNLIKNGYFKGELEGSILYKQLLNKAKDFYISNGLNNRDGCHSDNQYARLSSLFENLVTDVAQLKLLEKNLLPASDDSWLNISEAELEDHLATTYGVQRKQTQNMSEALTKFLGEVSDLEGIETIISKESEKLASSNPNDSVSFNPNKFNEVIQGILDLSIPEDDFDSEDDSDFDYSHAHEDEAMKDYFKQMDKELKGTTMEQSFIKSGKESVPEASVDEFDDVEDFVPVDIDKNALVNILESYSSQMGLSGPASTLLNNLGVKLKTDENQSKPSS